ncbi:MAG: hypothetical protein Q9190_007000, partial [Brigantiaea leucoxantha]
MAVSSKGLARDVEKGDPSNMVDDQEASGGDCITVTRRPWYDWLRMKTTIAQKIFPDQPPVNIIRKIEDCPLGYPRVAAFMDSDDNFMMYRRFGFLYSRILLSKQDELRELEDTLDDMDKRDSLRDEHSRKCLMSRTKDFHRKTTDGRKPRSVLIQEIEKKLYEYGQILLQNQQLVAMNHPSTRDHLSVQYFMENGFEENGKHMRPLIKADTEFVYRAEDLITLRPGRESAWLDAFVERLLKWINCRPVR